MNDTAAVMTIDKVFTRNKPAPKPRGVGQTWLKDVGFDEAPWYVERMGLLELEDFLQVAAPGLDYVKVATPQVLWHPSNWLKEKIALYQRFEVEPYLDHSYFVRAFRLGRVEDAIAAGAELGFRVIEFMNTFGDVSDETWKSWRQIAIDHGMRIIYEHHPERNWRKGAKDVPSTAEQIVEGAIPFLEHGAFTLLIDHEEIEIQGDNARGELGKVVDRLGLDKIIFEITSPKEAPQRWLDDLIAYFDMFGPNCNVSNVMPSQALYVEALRNGERPGELLAQRRKIYGV
ncbi:phosphosulfolactate synthase [Agrobacterium rhizogenes]|uniref:phosphosulfolactate synthase n=1 Tax=Rhizobium rhizogenes TaxID=359 RepID=UPI0022B7427C|nr:phosphosulfolactate synthase [Rhizobium rhizogenes]MCZ7447267.1 phosphosulfolactate synthase [Rhizobium rhizogenes]